MEGHRWQRALDAITRIHRAGLAPDMWPAALEAVATALVADKVIMFGVDLRAGLVRDLRTRDIEGDATDLFAAYYHRLDPGLQEFRPEWRSREPIPGTRIISEIAAGLSIHSARSTLKQVFAKTDTCSQADLVRLLLLERATA